MKTNQQTSNLDKWQSFRNIYHEKKKKHTHTHTVACTLDNCMVGNYVHVKLVTAIHLHII